MNKREPTPAHGIPPAPDYLSPAARSAYLQFAALLDEMGVITRADGPALERLCLTYIETVTLTKFLEQNGRSYEMIAQSGTVMHRARPENNMLSDADRRLHSYLSDFGLTPSARARVQVVAQDRQTSLDSYFA